MDRQSNFNQIVDTIYFNKCVEVLGCENVDERFNFLLFESLLFLDNIMFKINALK